MADDGKWGDDTLNFIDDVLTNMREEGGLMARIGGNLFGGVLGGVDATMGMLRLENPNARRDRREGGQAAPTDKTSQAEGLDTGATLAEVESVMEEEVALGNLSPPTVAGVAAERDAVGRA